jgi:glycosyltransferase involved in cell wall biosynthesis
LFSFFLPRKFTFWIKYAGDWGQINPPLSNRIQRFWLKKNWANCKVTINGFWNSQTNHCYSFENPCLTELDIENGVKIAENKVFDKPFNFCFVGRLDEVKGVSKIISSFKGIPLELINSINIIGDGKDIVNYKKDAAFLGDKIVFHGFQEKIFVHKIMETAHFFLLPSSAEGFPKVVAEAACYGVIPIVSDVGSISHYINSDNGFIWNSKSNLSYESVFQKAVLTQKAELKEKSKKILFVAKLFTFENYKNKLEKFIFSDSY